MTLRVLIFVAIFGATFSAPLASAHFSDRILSFDFPGQAYHPQFSCSGSALLPSKNECLVENVGSVPHTHVSFVFPVGGMGGEEVNIQETVFRATSDYVTWYDRTCQSPTPYITGATCIGGSVRSWHEYEYQKIRLEGGFTVCIPGLCEWAVGVDTQ